MSRGNLGLFFSFMVPSLQINGYLGSLNYGRGFFRQWGEAHAKSILESTVVTSLRFIPPRLGILETHELDPEDPFRNPESDALSGPSVSVTHINTPGK